MRKFSAIPVTAATVLVVVALAASLTGCGGDSPEGAVNKYLSAWQALDWNAFESSVAPDNRLSGQDEEEAKIYLEQIPVEFKDIKLSTTLDPKDKNKAKVVITGGTVTYKPKIIGKEKTDTKDFSKIAEDARTYDVVRINGVWYVNTELIH
ncbi:MAG: hypothetical protein V1748_12010 [Actinomycetota bacterium]